MATAVLLAGLMCARTVRVGYSGLWTLMKACTANCMADAQSTCCFVPNEVAWMFPCCRAMMCCPDQLGTARATRVPTIAVAGVTKPRPSTSATVAPTRASPMVGCKCDKCLEVTHSVDQCTKLGFDCACSKACVYTPVCTRCLAMHYSAVQCQSMGLNCACGSVASGHRHLLGATAWSAAPRGLPAVAVSVAVEVCPPDSSPPLPPLIVLARCIFRQLNYRVSLMVRARSVSHTGDKLCAVQVRTAYDLPRARERPGGMQYQDIFVTNQCDWITKPWLIECRHYCYCKPRCVHGAFQIKDHNFT